MESSQQEFDELPQQIRGLTNHIYRIESILRLSEPGVGPPTPAQLPDLHYMLWLVMLLAKASQCAALSAKMDWH